jgi:phosphomannomutase
MQSIYKAYDVRGIYPAQINTDSIHIVGRKCAHLFDSGKIVISQDGRHGGAEIRRAFCEGLLKEGGILGKDFDLIQVDMSTTPMFYFLVNHNDAAGGAMMTASHNPKEHNGVKAVSRGAVPISGTEIEAVQL